ncbi:MAG: hypothetical protein KGL36_04270 [Gammaproteobacteria bacterium]|nr:hypothetical protein [Gammaproteobacteria bacterium]
MTESTATKPPPDGPRLARAFVDEQHLLDRYLDGDLPYKGAREFEQWCAIHPQYLAEQRLADRTQASLRLLEAAGRAPDLADPQVRWWRASWLPIALGAIAAASLIGLWTAAAHGAWLRDQLTEARARLAHGSMRPPASEQIVRVSPDRGADSGAASIALARSPARLVALRIRMGYVRADRFRLAVDKHGAGRALELDGLTKDSNGDLRITFNASALEPGEYAVRVEAMPLLGRPVADGWFTMSVR